LRTKRDEIPGTMSPDWKDVYAELRNKIRWAIGSTANETGVLTLPFTQQVALSGPLAQDALESLQAIYEKPNLRVVGE